jgi:hypothetical protein
VTVKRYALVTGRRADASVVSAYLPRNYRVEWAGEFDGEPALVIGGRDDHGWTLDQYVLPRLGSGLIRADEIDLSHAVMKLVPA